MKKEELPVAQIEYFPDPSILMNNRYFSNPSLLMDDKDNPIHGKIEDNVFFASLGTDYIFHTGLSSVLNDK